jgi:galactose mutarotase-like enzyme
MHGVPWSLVRWEVSEAGQDFVAARLDWSDPDLLAIFPFRHSIELTATIRIDGLTLETRLAASSRGTVPVSFGFHPYFNLPELPRTDWELEIPAMRNLVLDSRGIPTGDEEAFGGFKGQLGESNFDDGFALTDAQNSFSITRVKRRISVDFLAGYRFAQVFAPRGKDYIAFEPMTSPTSALTTGRGLRLVPADESFRASFRVRVEALV